MIRRLLITVPALLCVFALAQPVRAADEAHAAPEHAAAPAELTVHGDHVSTAEGEHAQGDAHHGDGGHAATGQHDEHAYSIWGDLSLWSFVAFIGFCVVIQKLGLWDLLLSNMADREKAEWATLDEADKLLTQAEGTLRKFRGQFEALDDMAREAVAEGHRDADYTRTDLLQRADKEAAAAVARASFEIERVKDQTLSSLFATLADRVVVATEGVLKSRIQAEDEDRLIDATLSELSR